MRIHTASILALSALSLHSGIVAEGGSGDESGDDSVVLILMVRDMDKNYFQNIYSNVDANGTASKVVGELYQDDLYYPNGEGLLISLMITYLLPGKLVNV